MQAIIVAVCSFVLAVVFGKLLIPVLRALKAGQHLRGVFGVVEFPQPVQRGAQAVFPRLKLRKACKAP